MKGFRERRGARCAFRRGIIASVGERSRARKAELPARLRRRCSATRTTSVRDRGDRARRCGSICRMSRCRRGIAALASGTAATSCLRGASLDRGTPAASRAASRSIDRADNRFEIQPSPGVVVPASLQRRRRAAALPVQERRPLLRAALRPAARHPQAALQGHHALRRWALLGQHARPGPDGAHPRRGLGARVSANSACCASATGLSCLYTTGAAIALEDSANLTMHGVSVYRRQGRPQSRSAATARICGRTATSARARHQPVEGRGRLPLPLHALRQHVRQRHHPPHRR